MPERTELRLARTAPSSALDLWDDEVLRDPYPAYAELRALGPLVYLERYGNWAVTKHRQAREVLGDHAKFTSTLGIGLNDRINEMGQGILASDPPEHDTMREVLAEQLSPRGVGKVRDQIESEADELVASVVSRGSFDAVADLAEPFPVSVVAGLIGIPPPDRTPLLGFAESAFTSWGPLNERTERHLPNMEKFLKFCVARASRENLEPGGWGMAVYEAADRGVISHRTAIELLGAYLGAGMDTTISAISSAIMLFAQHPEQWDLVRSEPTLLNSAFLEVLRMESPIQLFSRVATEDYEVDGTVAPAGSRLIVLYGCANRDDDRYPDAGRFDVRRKPGDHVAFGFGLHNCAGQFLARVETVAILRALADQVETMTIGTPRYQLNNLTRRLGRLPITVEPARA